ncbi:unnamed protein product [Vitrella brassicaformis CCMP3155]|uniref:non-specific serine/threonine protein kinase n=1 Tax=Vitrella brassicaformis (strain CCMP3155) TaxID=1169540 RepID=A0A0G4E9L9_VITBC|nr:unnamed protein product [Vitrella brassicaformis CCMP3155]|eukprot:CEL92113.1 unnamed protein product [Vitrella brassicaformis CCMP3155]
MDGLARKAARIDFSTVSGLRRDAAAREASPGHLWPVCRHHAPPPVQHPSPIPVHYVQRDSPLGSGPCFPKPFFTNDGLLGEGSEGAAFRASRRDTGRVCALRKVANKVRYGLDQLGRVLFMNKFDVVHGEMMVLGRLQGLKKVLQLKGVYHMEGASFFELEYLAEGSLYTRCGCPTAIYVDNYGRSAVSESLAREWASQLITANKGLIARGVYHGDYHANNIMFERADSQDLKMIDFGNALLFDPSQGNTTVRNKASIVGSLFIHAPETFVPHGVFDAEKAAVHAIGRLMRQLLCWGHENISDTSSYAPPVFGRRDLSPECIALLTQMTEADPTNCPTLDECAKSSWFEPPAATRTRPATKRKSCC